MRRTCTITGAVWLNVWLLSGCEEGEDVYGPNVWSEDGINALGKALIALPIASSFGELESVFALM